MSHPFDGVPAPPLGDPELLNTTSSSDPNIELSLAQLGRKHYKWSNSTSQAASEWLEPPQGRVNFFRGYFYLKSACDPRNQPFPLASWTAPELAKMPHYYIQKLPLSMAQTVQEDVKGHDEFVIRSFLPDDELMVYVNEWRRTGFQGALNWYRSGTSPSNNRELLLFAGRKIECPTTFISGKADWGNYQKPGALEAMPEACTNWQGAHFIEGAGHWPQQEQPDRAYKLVIEFLNKVVPK